MKWILGTIKDTHHTIDLKKGPCSIRQQPYCAGRWPREVLRTHIEKQLEASVIERTQSKWTSPIVLDPKKDDNLPFSCELLVPQRRLHTRHRSAATYWWLYWLLRRSSTVYCIGCSMRILARANQRWEQEKEDHYVSNLNELLNSYAIGLTQRTYYVPTCVVCYSIWSLMEDSSRLYIDDLVIIQKIDASTSTTLTRCWHCSTRLEWL